MKLLTPLLFLFVIFLIPFSSGSQNRKIFGSVTTLKIIPVIHAEVAIKSTKQTVFTDSLGNFELTCDVKDKIRVSANGFYTQNIKVESGSDSIFIDLKLKPQKSGMAVHSGHIANEVKLNSLMQLNDSENDFSTYNDIYEILENRFPNVHVEDGGIIIGSSSMSGSSYALVVIDGVISNFGLGMVKPQDIKNIEILKPGGESAAYGSQGGNGVIRITTKRGGDFN